MFYRIFIHQAILSALMLARLAPDQWHELARQFNYPLHLCADDTPERRPQSINDLVTCRYEQVFDDPGWQTRLPVREPLLSWLKQQFSSTDEG